MKLSELKNKKILILGFGKEGRDTLKFLKRLFPKKKIAVADVKFAELRSSHASTKASTFDKNYLKVIKNYDVVIKSPGIPIHLPEVEKAYKEGKIKSQTEIFLENYPGQVISVTGTKGKSTTSFWIYQTLKKAGLPVKLAGNIGKPALSFLLTAKPQDIFVYELSSHQLYGIKKSPQVALLLNVYPEHGDYYRSFGEYALTKANITRYQTKKDYFIYNSQDKICRKIAKSSKARKIPIQGKYYQLNREAVKAVAKIFKAPLIKKFESLSHRLEFIGEFKKIRFYNDSLSTIPQTTIEALDYLGERVHSLILGGFDRGQDFTNLAKRIKKSKIKNVILFPPTGPRIWKTILKHQRKPSPQGRSGRKERSSLRPLTKPNHFFVDNMVDAVKLAYSHTGKGKICLLSPASASFGIFKDYRQRGNLFKKWVKKYGRAKT